MALIRFLPGHQVQAEQYFSNYIHAHKSPSHEFFGSQHSHRCHCPPQDSEALCKRQCNTSPLAKLRTPSGQKSRQEPARSERSFGIADECQTEIDIPQLNQMRPEHAK